MNIPSARGKRCESRPSAQSLCEPNQFSPNRSLIKRCKAEEQSLRVRTPQDKSIGGKNFNSLLCRQLLRIARSHSIFEEAYGIKTGSNVGECQQSVEMLLSPFDQRCEASGV